MSAFETRTPEYRGQDVSDARTAEPRLGLCERIDALFRTPTPTYQGKLEDTPDNTLGTADGPADQLPAGDASEPAAGDVEEPSAGDVPAVGDAGQTAPNSCGDGPDASPVQIGRSEQ